MPKVKNSKHKVQVTLPDGFELIDGELVKKSHGGHVTGDQYEYGLTTFNPHAGDSTGPKDTDVRYSLSSVPRDIANIEAEGGETVLTDLSNDGQFGLYDITGPRHSSGGVPMLLPEQSFIFSDTQKMKMGKDMLAEHGIQSRKKMTPAKVSKQYNLNKYYGILNDEYADKVQANTADLMLQKNKEGLSKLAFQSEMMKGFEEGVPLAAYPYLQSIGMDPFEFSQKMEGMQQGPGDQQAQPMNQADTQAMNPMAAYGRELNRFIDGGDNPVNPNRFDRFEPMAEVNTFDQPVTGGGRDFTTHFVDTSLPDGFTKNYMTNRKGEITGQAIVPAGEKYNTRKLYRQYKRGKVPGESFYDGKYGYGGTPMNEADAQAMSAMASYGRELREAQYGNTGGIGIANFQNFNQRFDDKNYKPSIRSAYMPMNLGVRGDALGAVSGLIEAGGRLFGKKDKDGDGLMDGAFRDMKAKRARNKARKAMSYNYDIDVKGNDAADYDPSAMELYDASTHWKERRGKNTLEKGSAPTADEYLKKNAMLKYNPETMQYDYKIQAPEEFRTKNKDIISKNQEELEGYKAFGEMQNEMSSLSQDEKRALRYTGETISDFKKDMADGNIPEGMQFGMDARGGIGYYDKGATLPEGSQDRIDEMMMTGSYNKRLGGGLRKANNGFGFDPTQLVNSLTNAGIIDQQPSYGPMGPTPYQQQMINQAEQAKNDPASFFQNFNPQTFGQTDDYANIQNLGPDLDLQKNGPNRAPKGDATVTRDKGNLATRMQRGIDNFNNSPLVNAFGEASKFATAGADFLNEAFKNKDRRQAEQDLLKMGMADNMGVQEGTALGQGTYDENSGNVYQIMQGVSPFGGNASYYGKHGFEIPRANDGEETKSWKVGDELTGGTDEWVDWYMSDENKKGRKKRYETYVLLQERAAKQKGKSFDRDNLPSEDEFHDTYVRAQRQINAIQDFYKDDQDFLKRKDWDSKYKYGPGTPYATKDDLLSAIRKGTLYGDEKKKYELGKNHRYKESISLINEKIKADNPDLESEELNKLLFTALDDAGINLFQGGYQASQIADVADNDEFVEFLQSGVDDDQFTFDGVTYDISPIDSAFGNTTVGQREKSTVPIYPCKPCPSGPDKGKVPERDENGKCPCGDCPTCPEGQVPGTPSDAEPCPCEDAPKIDEPEDAVMIEPTPMTPFIQDLLKTQAIADRERDMFFPWEPAVRRENVETMLEDPNRAINAALSQYGTTAEALGAFGGKSQLMANLTGAAGQTADNVANLISGVNARNVASVNNANRVNTEINMRLNQMEDASRIRQYDNTQKVLQTYMDEKNFDREQYADAMANTITNMANAYNTNQMYDYYNIDPMSGGAIYQSGAKQFAPSPEQDEWAFMNDWMEATKRAKALGLVDDEGQVDSSVIKGILEAKSGQRNYIDPREEQLKAMNQYMSGYQGSGKKGKEIKKWASPFYTGKMGI